MKRERNSMLVLALIAGFMIGALSLPGDLRSGSLEPTDPPGPTMKTLDEIPPTWSQMLPADDGEPNGCNSSRFKCVLNNYAVLDKETGLVWDRSPSTGETDWISAHQQCYEHVEYTRLGWRLPTIEELSSLIDLLEDSPPLPSGHPFINVMQDKYYWSSTPFLGDTDFAWSANFVYTGGVGINPKAANLHVWCVRGGQGYVAY